MLVHLLEDLKSDLSSSGGRVGEGFRQGPTGYRDLVGIRWPDPSRIENKKKLENKNEGGLDLYF